VERSFTGGKPAGGDAAQAIAGVDHTHPRALPEIIARVNQSKKNAREETADWRKFNCV
jgi:hypothetical protein